MSLSVSVVPGYTIADGEKLTDAILRLIANPTVQLQGSISASSIADGSVTTQKMAPGFLSANAAGRALVANGFVTLVMLGSGIFTADTSGRAPFASGFVNNGLLATAAVDGPNLTEAAAKQTYAYALDTGTANTYAITLAPVPTTYVDGMLIRFKAINANTGASTVNVNSLGPKTLKKRSNVGLVAGNIAANQMIEAIYDATAGVFQIISPLPGPDFVGTGSVPAASAATVIAHGLGAVPARVRVVLLQNTASSQQGYAQNDEVELVSFEAGSSGEPILGAAADATNVTVPRANNANVNILPKGGGATTAITAGNWLVKVYAWL